jgi:hypothetical protein
MRKRTFSSCPSLARFLPCWVIQAESGWALTPARWTRLLESSMKKSTYRVFSPTVSTVKKSQARIAAACWARNCLHVGPLRRGAGEVVTAGQSQCLEQAAQGEVDERE